MLRDTAMALCMTASVEHEATASVMGGIAAHECVKLLTHQYIPINNCLLFDSYTGNTLTMKL